MVTKGFGLACPAPALAPQPQLMQRSTLPLLRQLAGRPDSPVRPAIALVVEALAEGPGVQLPAAERERWSETLLQWLVALPGSSSSSSSGAEPGPQQRREAAEQAELMPRLAAALVALAAPAGSEGLHVAHAWLAEMIVHLSHQVRPFNDVPAPQDTAAAAAASGWRWYWPFSSTSTSTSTSSPPPSSTSGVSGAEAAMAALVPPLQPGGADLPAEAPSAAADSPYLPLDAAAASAAHGVLCCRGGSSSGVVLPCCAFSRACDRHSAVVVAAAAG